MKRVFYLVMLILGLSVLHSCEKEAVLSINPTSLSFEEKGGSQTISINTNRAWTITSSDSWCKASKSSGEAGGESITISCEANNSFNERNCVITIKAESLTQTINISQKTNYGLIISKDIYELSNAAQTIKIAVQSNVDYEYFIVENAKDWIFHSETKSLVTNDVVFDIAANESFDNREGTIIFKQIDGTLTCSVSVMQEGKEDVINFSDSKVETLCLEAFDTNKSGKLSKKEALNVKSLPQLFSSEKSITSFDELKYFAAITEIPVGFFEGCSRLTSVELPENLKKISENSFLNCLSISKLYLPEKVSEIGNSAFSGCEALLEVNIPKGVRKISYGCFSNCSNLKEISLPDGLTEIEPRAFYKCSKLNNINFPEGLVSIGESAFYYCHCITSVVMPDTVTYVGPDAFHWIGAIEQFVLSSSLKTLEKSVFEYCNFNVDIIIPKGVTVIKDWAFKNFFCWHKVDIPETVEEIGEQVFQSNGWPPTIICRAGIPPLIHENTFDWQTEQVYVPQESIDSYQNAAIWSQLTILPIEE